MQYEGPEIILSEVAYRTLGGATSDGATVKITSVKYLGILARKSDGLTVLSVRKPGSTKAFNVEIGNVVSVSARGNNFIPETHCSRWRLRAAEFKAFIEGVELEEWVKPYFDPKSAKYHVETTAADAAAESEVIADERPGFLRRLWRRIRGER